MNSSDPNAEIMSIAALTVDGSSGQNEGRDRQFMRVYQLEIVVTSDGLARPHFKCGLCGKIVTDAREANLVWNSEHTDKAVVVCKRGCDKLMRLTGSNQWIPLNVAMLYLLTNSKVDLKATNREAAILASVG